MIWCVAKNRLEIHIFVTVNYHYDCIMLTVRLSQISDIEVIMDIYDHAKNFMAVSGNRGQWVNGYPQRKLIESDIENGYSHVVTGSGGRIVGVFSFIIGSDPTYAEIEGAWLDDSAYGTIHRIASAGVEKGVADCCLAYCLSKIGNIRIDTHSDNVPMRRWIAKSSFHFCGIIHTHDGSPRLAFQLRK